MLVIDEVLSRIEDPRLEQYFVFVGALKKMHQLLWPSEPILSSFFWGKKNVFSLMRPFRRKKLWSRLNNVVWHRTKLRRIRIHQGKSTHPPPNTWWCLKILAKGTIVILKIYSRRLKSYAKEDWNVSERRDRGSERRISHRRKCFLITSSKVSIKVITLS
jgi:hypothetical protein